MARVEINQERCKGCSLCVTFCPKQIISLSQQQINAKGYAFAMVDESGCNACGICGQVCPDLVFTVWRS